MACLNLRYRLAYHILQLLVKTQQILLYCNFVQCVRQLHVSAYLLGHYQVVQTSLRSIVYEVKIIYCDGLKDRPKHVVSYTHCKKLRYN
jgi:hypothetical protein